MYRDNKVAAIITAAGSGLRMGGDIPKQYQKIGDEMVLEKAIKAFEKHPFIDDIYLVVRSEDMLLCSTKFGKENGFVKTRAIISGGNNRQASVYNGLRTIEKSVFKQGAGANYKNSLPKVVLIHDGARPFVSENEISRLTEAAVSSGAASLGVAPKDSVVKVENMWIKENLDRNELYLMQTPQAFRLSMILKAHKKARKENFIGTDDTVLVRRLGEQVSIITGNYDNFKITTPQDMRYAKAHLDRGEGSDANRQEIRIGTGFDTHTFIKARDLIIGGVNIPWKLGLKGHSDADVLTHAIMDSLLGGCGLGDIGMHFPDKDSRYEGISSIELLDKVKSIISAKGFEIGNIDSIVIAELPKIAPYVGEMKKNIAKALNLNVEKINIKGTTTEGLGFCGRGEGIAAMASSTIYKR
ncbi:MAG TPA: 2-C-methyl-D-erythritol 4-phosphate cytidylyltransferase [Anaerovoracaceae bacterium]|nr:2-C-methyl-D-erythritol 4-phosphate cytidylyltransferase [Anaerovoracaceae bacterium]